MNDEEMKARVDAMARVISGKANKSATEIESKGKEEFNAEVEKIVNELREKIIAQNTKKIKEIETQYAIAKSLAINKKRLEKIRKRQELMHELAKEAKAEVVKELKDKAKCEKFVQDLIAQGLLMLLEPEVLVKCRKCDEALVKKCLTAAEQMYAKVVKEKTGATKTCKLTIAGEYLDPEPVEGKDLPSCLGGVVLSCFGGKIKVDNTIDARLNLVMEQDKPAIRAQLFPSAS